MPVMPDSHSFAIISGNTANTFAINASTGQLTVADASGLDAATTPSYRLTVRVTDTGSPALSDTGVVTINVADRNNPPELSGGPFAIAENSANGSGVGTMSVADADPGQSHTFVITAGNVSGAFAINAASGQITVASRGALDHEGNPSFTLTIRVTDDGTPAASDQAQVTIDVANVNEAPTAISLDNTTVTENQPAGTVVGILAASDPDQPPGSFTFTLVGGQGSADNSRFQISGNQLQTAGPLDFEDQPSYQVRMRATDAGGAFTGQAFTITATDANDPPTAITLTPDSIV
jgi:VCBS repeat-containing protein